MISDVFHLLCSPHVWGHWLLQLQNTDLCIFSKVIPAVEELVSNLLPKGSGYNVCIPTSVLSVVILGS